jgi:hypothetical protein
MPCASISVQLHDFVRKGWFAPAHGNYQFAEPLVKGSLNEFDTREQLTESNSWICLHPGETVRKSTRDRPNDRFNQISSKIVATNTD